MVIPQLLAPAGNFECLEAVFDHGADAAYIGIGPFNLRAYSPNFPTAALPEVMQFARGRNKRVYAVLNTMPTDAQLVQIEQFLKELSQQTLLPHAFVVSDPGVVAACKEYVPAVPLHLSTQTGTFNHRAVRFWVEQGITRVIVPREFTLEQVHAVSSLGICETELFIHGAMCVSLSGRCLLGAYLSGRHANQGECPQPCRYRYAIAPQDADTGGERQWFSAEEDAQGVYLLNAKDLNTLPILPEIIATGVTSLKIEGRNKSVHYVSAVVKTYRAALDRFSENPQDYSPEAAWFDELEKLDHRPYTTGFYNGEYRLQETAVSKAQSRIRVVGVVKGMREGGDAVVDVKNPFTAHEPLSVLPVNRKRAPYTVSFSKLTDLNGNSLDRALTNRLAVVASDARLAVGDIIRRMV